MVVWLSGFQQLLGQPNVLQQEATARMARGERPVGSKWKSRARLSALEQMRRYVLFPLYTTWVLIGVLIVYALVVQGPRTPWVLTYCVAFVVHVAVSVLVLRGIALQEVEDLPLARWGLPGLALSSAAASGVGLLMTQLDDSISEPPFGPLSFPFGPVVLPLLLTAWAVAPRLAWQWILVTASGLGLVMVCVGWLMGVDVLAEPWDALRTLWLPTFTLLVVMMLTIRWSIIVTASVTDQAKMDAMRADLAVAEERLRIARDMHDVLGRTLTAVALKSELAAVLASAGRAEDAAAESRAVHLLADGALRELRGVLAGYRRPDLATELAGAKGLLDSAGVSTRVIGESRGIPVRASEAFSWVLREAATNIVRHSDASRCTIRIDSEPGHVKLTVNNDGAHEFQTRRFVTEPDFDQSDGDVDQDVPGSGLVGLRSRLAGMGATLAAEVRGDTFVLVARVAVGEDSIGGPEVARDARAVPTDG